MNSELIEKILVAALAILGSPPQQFELYEYRITYVGAGLIQVCARFTDEQTDYGKWISSRTVNAATIGLTQDQIMNLSTHSIYISE